MDISDYFLKQNISQSGTTGSEQINIVIYIFKCFPKKVISVWTLSTSIWVYFSIHSSAWGISIKKKNITDYTVNKLCFITVLNLNFFHYQWIWTFYSNSYYPFCFVFYSVNSLLISLLLNSSFQQQFLFSHRSSMSLLYNKAINLLHVVFVGNIYRDRK